ncbi:MAG: sporulation protein YqfD [Lachnospiraceae bacterium]|nr:sporulation protein YqfD [Lachnospiraceae bacterium]
MIKFFRYFKGYLTIKVWGYSTERFMNLCSHHNIFLWDIINHGEYYTMSISIPGFFSLRSITRKTGTKVVVTGRYGLPFFMKRIKRKKVFISGGVLALLLVFWMQSYVWDIEIEGNYMITEDVFMDFLKEQNIYVGMPKKKLDIESLEKDARIYFDSITWTSAKLVGNKLVVSWKENTLMPPEETKQYTENTGYDLISEREGVVLSIITRNGVPKVKEGDLVKEGDVLVEGRIPIFEEDGSVKYYEYCTADADITLKYTLSVQEKYPDAYEKYIYTGEEKKKFYLQYKDRILTPKGVSVGYKEYDCLDEKFDIPIGNKRIVPLYFGIKTYREYERMAAKYSTLEMKQKMQERGMKIIQTLEEKGVQIIEKNVTINKENNQYKMGIDFIVSENVGLKSKTQIQDFKEDSEKELVKENEWNQ